MFAQKAQELGMLLLGIAVVLVLLTLPVVFILGSFWASMHLLPPLVTIGWVALALDIILLPLSIFRPLRGFTGGTIFLSSYLFGLVTWLLGFIITYAFWGLAAVIVGMFILGFGVVPIALLATGIKGYWDPFITLVIMLAVTVISRLIGALIMSAARST